MIILLAISLHDVRRGGESIIIFIHQVATRTITCGDLRCVLAKDNSYFVTS